jgi:hypothetical protein
LLSEVLSKSAETARAAISDRRHCHIAKSDSGSYDGSPI